jgi:Activator of Hsp90 ATPase homolog 1-like protein
MKNNQDFKLTFLLKNTPKEVFDAINNVRGWWSEEIEGNTEKLGSEFSYHYKDVHRCKIKITELIPGKKVVWRVLDNYFNFIEDQSEWKGTDIRFEISKKGNQTELRFAHLGLVPEYECFDVCSNAWTTYVNDSLRSLIMTGKGAPNKIEENQEEASR